MATDALDRLTPEQRDCLRLVQAGFEAKEIGVALSITTNVVNEHLRAARRRLQVTSSRQAARLLAAHEGAAPNPLVNKPIGIAEAASGDALTVVAARGQPTDDGHHDRQPAQAPAPANGAHNLFHDPPHRAAASPWPPFGGQRWQLAWWQKLLAAGALAILITLFFAGLTAVMAAGLGELSRR